MMKTWAKIEETINYFLLFLGHKFFFFIPRRTLKPQNRKKRFSLKNGLSWFVLSPLQAALQMVQNISQSSFMAVKEVAIQLRKNPLHTLSTPFAISLFFLFAMGVGAIFYIHGQWQKIIEKRELLGLSSTTKEVILNYRPAYFRKNEKQFEVYNVVLPSFLEGGYKVKKLTIDFIFESSNKYIRAYFQQNPHLVKNTLYSTFEQMAVDFPLEKEGKRVVKEKIILEMNLLLKKLNIKGEITNIYIAEINGG